MKLLFISGDKALAQGKKGPFYYLLEEFSQYWERIDIICPKIRNPKSEIRNNVQKFFNNVYVHSSPWPIIFQPWFICKKGLEIFKKEKFDIFGIHSYPPFYNDFGGMWLHNKTKVPYVLEVMHINGYPKASGFKERVYKILTKWFVKYFAKRSRAVRAINYKQVPEFLIKSGVDKGKIKISPAFYLDFNVFKPLDLNKKYDVVFSARLVKNKGIGLLLGAINIAKDQIPGIKLIITGNGPMENKIRRFIKANCLENNVELAGWVPTIDDLAKIYNQSKIFAMPSFNEGGPRVTLEAMACKVPILTSRVGIMLDIIKDSAINQEQANGMFINWDSKDIANKIIELLENNDLRDKIAENGYKTVQQFEKRKLIENYAKTYQDLLYPARV